MFDELVFEAQVQHRFGDAGGLQGFADGAAGAAHDGALFDGDQGFMAGRYLEQQFGVERLGPAHVDHGGTEFFGGLQCGVEQRAESQDGDAGAFAADFALPKGSACEPGFGLDAGAGAARVAHGHRMVLFKGGAQQLAAFASSAGQATLMLGMQRR
jgi:hypothetical protein